MPHPCEPSLEQLHEIRKALFADKSTDGNMQKLSAVEKQISRLEAEKKASEGSKKA